MHPKQAKVDLATRLVADFHSPADAERAAAAFEANASLPDGARMRRVRVIRDYGMFDRREAPQYYPDVKGAETIHA